MDVPARRKKFSRTCRYHDNWTVTVGHVTATPERQSAPSSAGDRTDGDTLGWAERSAFGTIRGMPWWGAVVLATLLTALGTLLDVLVWNEPGILFTASYVVGCLLAIALVRRRSLFGPMVQPPLVLAIAMPVVVLTLGAGVPDSGGTTATVLAVATPLIKGFPVMAITTCVVLGVGLLRMFRLERASPRGSAENSEATTKRASPRPPAAADRPSGGRPRPGKPSDGGKKRPPEAAPRQRPPGKGTGPRPPAKDSEPEQRAAGRPQRRGDTGRNPAPGRPRRDAKAGNAAGGKGAPRERTTNERPPEEQSPGKQGGRPRGQARGEQPPPGRQPRGGQPPGRTGGEGRPGRGEPPGRGSGPRQAPPGRATPPDRQPGGEPPRRPRRPRRDDG